MNRGLFGISPESSVPLLGPQGYPSVVGSPAFTPGTLARPVVIPGFNGSPDIKPSGVLLDNNAMFNDEFDEVGPGCPPGWTPFGTYNVLNTVDVPSHLHLSAAATSGDSIYGITRPTPAVYPYTITAKLSDMIVPGKYFAAGIFIAPAGAMSGVALMTMGYVGQGLASGEWQFSKFNSLTSFNTTYASTSTTPFASKYLRLIVTSATSIAAYYSFGGLAWYTLATAQNPSFTPAQFGVHSDSNNNSASTPGTPNSYFDWIRVT
jgi:hypothetical protein